MEINQVFDIVNTATSEMLGEETIVQEDLSNIVDIGKEVLDNGEVDNYVRKLVNHIGKVIFDDRVYSGNIPSVLMDSWEYGSILQKITSEIPEATENESWGLTDGESYNDDIFYQPKVSAKFFNNKVTFEVPVSFTERQVKESFSSASQLSGFLSMIYNSVEKAMTIKIDSLVMRAINNMTAETLVDDLLDVDVLDTTKSGIKAINLLEKYNTHSGKALEVSSAYTDKEFIKFATYTINLYKDRMSKISNLFNIGGKSKFTPSGDITTVLLSDFASSIGVFCGSELQNQENISLPTFETVPFWQGSGLEYSFDDVSKIDVKTASGQEVSVGGILGVMFDKQSVGVVNLDKRVTTNYNAKAEFYTNFYKLDSGYLNDLNENYLVFFIG